jgi:hypothetical protein
LSEEVQTFKADKHNIVELCQSAGHLTIVVEADETWEVGDKVVATLSGKTWTASIVYVNYSKTEGWVAHAC